MATALVVVPTYNERENVGELASAVRRAAPDADLLFVDDSSPDGTGQALDERAAADPAVHVLHRSEKQGLGRAYVAGFEWALARDYGLVLEMDADFSHTPADVPRLIAAAGAADLVVGSRYVGGVRIINWPLRRLVLSKSASLYVRLVTGMPFADPTSGFKCYRRAVLESIGLASIRSNGYSFQVETVHRAWRMGFRVAEVPIVFEERRSGHSKMNAAIVREALWMVWRMCFQAGFRRRGGPPHPRSVARVFPPA